MSKETQWEENKRNKTTIFSQFGVFLHSPAVIAVRVLAFHDGYAASRSAGSSETGTTGSLTATPP
jgi:hypothetical protein